MSGVSADQEGQIKELAINGNKITAIAQYREITGVGLKEAKDLVEALMLGAPANDSAPLQAGNPDSFLENRIQQLLAEHKKIEAIKAYREVYHCGLKEAKDAVDLIQAEMRREGYSSLPAMPANRDDPFVEDNRRNRSFLMFVFVFLLVVIAGLALFFLTGNGF